MNKTVCAGAEWSPVQNVPPGLLKSKEYSRLSLDSSQLAVCYAAYGHPAKEATRNLAGRYNWKRLLGLGAAGPIALGGWITQEYVGYTCRKRGLDTQRVDRIRMRPAWGPSVGRVVQAARSLPWEGRLRFLASARHGSLCGSAA